MSLRVLLVEDDRELRRTLAEVLQLEGYAVHTAVSLSEGLALLAHAGIDLVLLDLGLPDGDGQRLLTTLRRQQALPVVVISAQQADRRKVELLDAGADDYLVKPFSVAELLARLRVALRHRGTVVRPAVTHWRGGTLEVDLEHSRVRRAGAEVHLTPTEFRLLAQLVRGAGRVLTHRSLLAAVWGAEFVEHTHYLRLYMAQLRAKLEDDASDPQWLLTEPGVGYRLREGED